jgi:hypothetical protein
MLLSGARITTRFRKAAGQREYIYSAENPVFGFSDCVT